MFMTVGKGIMGIIWWHNQNDTNSPHLVKLMILNRFSLLHQVSQKTKQQSRPLLDIHEHDLVCFI